MRAGGDGMTEGVVRSRWGKGDTQGRDTGDQTTHRKYRASSIEHRAASLEPRASSIEHRASSLEPRASRIEPRASSLEPRASSLEPRASSIEPKSGFVKYQRNCGIDKALSWGKRQGGKGRGHVPPSGRSVSSAAAPR